MTAAEELTALETAYAAWIAAGCPQSYSVNGRSVQRVSAEWWTKRIDTLRAAVRRSTTGVFSVANFRSDD